MARIQQSSKECLCGSGLPLASCCGRYLSGQVEPPTAEALMRSRYTAYVLRDESWLRKSWHPDTCPAELELDGEDGGRWLGLKIKRTEAGGPEDETGVVEFVARYKIAGKGHRLHEISQFVRCDGQWAYHSGNVQD